jgi:hypothetical protein
MKKEKEVSLANQERNMTSGKGTGHEQMFILQWQTQTKRVQ